MGEELDEKVEQEEVEGDGDQLTPEEAAELGLDPEDIETGEKPDEDSEAEAEPEESEPKEEAETEVEDEDKAPVPQKRFKQVYGKMKELEEKVEELTKKPDQKEQEDETGQTFTPQAEKIGDMVVRGGEYDGMTLNEVYEIDPASATQMQNEYNQNIAAQKEAEESERQKAYQTAEKDIKDFEFAIANELFEKEGDLTAEESAKVEEATADLIAWMDKNGKTAYSLVDAHMLRTTADREKKAAEKGAKGVLESLHPDRTVRTMSSGAGGEKKTGYEKYIGISESELDDAIDKMSSKEYDDFVEKMPQALKDKFPDMPFD